jgi:hypothetical protein
MKTLIGLDLFAFTSNELSNVVGLLFPLQALVVVFFFRQNT